MLPLLAEINHLVYAPPLLAVVSLVYAGTRHEPMHEIVRHAAKFGAGTAVFMAALTAVIEVLSYFQ